MRADPRWNRKEQGFRLYLHFLLETNTFLSFFKDPDAPANKERHPGFNANGVEIHDIHHLEEALTQVFRTTYANQVMKEVDQTLMENTAKQVIGDWFNQYYPGTDENPAVWHIQLVTSERMYKQVQKLAQTYRYRYSFVIIM